MSHDGGLMESVPSPFFSCPNMPDNEGLGNVRGSEEWNAMESEEMVTWR